MKKIILKKNDFDLLITYCSAQRSCGKMRYMFEISLPDESSDEFFDWIELVEKAGLKFSLWLIERYENHKLFYGVSDFVIKEVKGSKVFCFDFENEDVLYNNFYKWNEESRACIISDCVAEALEDISRFI